jgi:hypothetical protein
MVIQTDEKLVFLKREFRRYTKYFGKEIKNKKI